MHKGVILLTKAENKEEALSKVEEFMEPYGNGDVWDWYSIGNRWNNTLAPKDKLKEFEEWIHEEYKDVFKDNFGYSINKLENEKDRPIIQAKWEELELKGKNPYYSAYGYKLDENEDGYNVVPLESCIETVREWQRDKDKAKEETWNSMVEAKKEAEEGKYDMSGYYAGIYKDIQYGDFSFECNVYNIDEQKAEDIPVNMEEWWAVMVDMHN